MDEGNTDQRPASITIRLFADNEEIDSKTVTADANGKWTWEFTELPKYKNGGVEIKYTITEDVIYETGADSAVTDKPLYTTDITDPTLSDSAITSDVTNTIAQRYVEVEGTKTWIDPEGTEHPTITINLLRDGIEIDEIELANGETEYKFTNLPKYAVPCDELAEYEGELDGHIFEYTVTEDAVEGYTSEQEETNFTNTIEQEYVEVEGAKTWVDPEGTEHATITINLLRDGIEIDEIELANGETEYKFTNLPKYAVPCDELAEYEGELDGHTFEYTVTEDAVDGYTTKQNGTNFTNTINQEYVEVEGTKTWVDPEGTVHPAITINLLQDGVEIDEIELANGETEYSFKDLEKYAADGHIYEYTVTEDAVDGYTTKQNGTDFTNTINQEYVEVEGTKTWVDPEGTVHPAITINLLQDGVEIDEIELENGTTEYSFKNLEKYAADGHIYEYTVTEDVVPGYTSVQNGTDFTNTIEQEWINVRVRKIWIDNGAENIVHPTITIRLFRDGEQIDWVRLSDGYTIYTFENLPKYNLETGAVYEYTVGERAPEGYVATVDGYTITNTSTAPEMITVSGTKTWVDDGRAHDNASEVKLTLSRKVAGGASEVVTDAEIVWNGDTYYFYNLRRADDEGNVYQYSVTEAPIENYGAFYDGFDITNRHAVDVTNIDISGTKHWNDNDNAAGIRPESVTVYLLCDGELIDTATASEENGWSYSFTDLPDNNGYGIYYNYTVSEELVPGYWLSVDGYDLYNTPRTRTTGEDEPTTTFGRLRVEELEELLTIFDYGVPLWGGLLGTGDEIPAYPFVLSGMGLLALVAYLALNHKRKRT